jgi:oxygen-independent coproporphyrinogen III oxidase
VKLGLYTHIPFCLSKCSYCHFISFPYEQSLASRYGKAVIKEIENISSLGGRDLVADSIYLGGGTPSLMPPDLIKGILTAFRSRFRIENDCEISLEANPGTLSRDKIDAFKNSGINRISIGAQSFADGELAAIGRIHRSQMIYEALGILKEGGFQNISLDLMLGLPFQTRESWKTNLDIVSQLNIPHISVYMLDLDDPCALADLVAGGSISIPEDDLVSDLYLETIDTLASIGYQQYEISNFAKPGYVCRHNLKYWQRDPVLGFGLASHSFDGKARWANKSTIDEYLEAIENGRNAEDWREAVGAIQAIQETLFLGLRMTNGIDLTGLSSECHESVLAKYAELFQRLSSHDMIKIDGGKVRLTPSGMLLSNEIFQQFI